MFCWLQDSLVSLEPIITNMQFGCWEFCENLPAQKASKNRPKGTLVTTKIIVGCKVVLDYLINKVLPKIKNIWPNKNDKILIKQDNATSHVPTSNLEFHEVAKEGGMGYPIVCSTT
jgi:hypothetical protein